MEVYLIGGIIESTLPTSLTEFVGDNLQILAVIVLFSTFGLVCCNLDKSLSPTKKRKRRISSRKNKASRDEKKLTSEESSTDEIEKKQS